MFNVQLDKSLGDYNIHKVENGPLYHYTSIGGLKGIVEDSQFWVTRSDFLNDPGEIEYFGYLVLETIAALRTTNSISEDWLNVMEQNYKTYFMIAYPSRYYILSLSTERDSLAMWNYYGRNDGYCIGIHYEHFLHTLKSDYENLIHGRVIYDSDEQISILDNELTQAHDFWKYHLNSKEELFHSAVDTLFSRWLSYALFFKHPSYQLEREYRIVIPHQNTLEVNYRTGQGIFIPFIKVNATEINHHDKSTANGRFPLESITISPYIKHDRAEKGLRGWLNKNKQELNDGEPTIYPSQVPIRF